MKRISTNFTLKITTLAFFLVLPGSCTIGGEIVNRTEKLWVSFRSENNTVKQLIVMRKPDIHQLCSFNIGSDKCTPDRIYNDLDIALINLDLKKTQQFNIKYASLLETAINIFNDPLLKHTNVLSMGDSHGDWICLQIYSDRQSVKMYTEQGRTFIYAINIRNNTSKSWPAVNSTPPLFADEPREDIGCTLLDRSYSTDQYGTGPTTSFLNKTSISKERWKAQYRNATTKNTKGEDEHIEFIKLTSPSGSVEQLPNSTWIFDH